MINSEVSERAVQPHLLSQLVTLFKLRVVSLLVFSALAGAFLGAGGKPSIGALLTVVVTGTLAAAGEYITQPLSLETDTPLAHTVLGLTHLFQEEPGAVVELEQAGLLDPEDAMTQYYLAGAPFPWPCLGCEPVDRHEDESADLEGIGPRVRFYDQETAPKCVTVQDVSAHHRGWEAGIWVVSGNASTKQKGGSLSISAASSVAGRCGLRCSMAPSSLLGCGTDPRKKRGPDGLRHRKNDTRLPSASSLAIVWFVPTPTMAGSLQFESMDLALVLNLEFDLHVRLGRLKVKYIIGDHDRFLCDQSLHTFVRGDQIPVRVVDPHDGVSEGHLGAQIHVPVRIRGEYEGIDVIICPFLPHRIVRGMISR
jgi:hypothetical protein